MLNIFKCKHDPNKEDCTLLFEDKKQCFTYPQKYNCMCSVCKKTFVFTKDEKTHKFKRI